MSTATEKSDLTPGQGTPAVRPVTPDLTPGFKKVEQVQTGIAKNMIGVSPKAVEAMRVQLVKRGTPAAAIRIGIRGGGCSGFSYAIEFDDNEPRKGDLVLELKTEAGDDVRVLCDKKSILYLGGSLLDWEKTLMFQGFKFRNPHEATSCGCGHSFTVA